MGGSRNSKITTVMSKPITSPYHDKKFIAVISVVLLLAAFYFIPTDCYASFTGSFIPAHRIAFPLAVLTLCGAFMIPWQMALAMMFSCIGDYMGSCSNFIMQMGGFALAHIMLITYFIRRYIVCKGAASRRKKSFITLGILTAMSVAIISFILIVPSIPKGVLQIGCIIYMILICTMLATAISQRNGIYACGALLFVLSDFILSWNKFVAPVEGEKYLIMVPYYLAQILLWVKAYDDKIRKILR